MIPDPEWAALQQDLHALAEPPAAASLRRRVERHDRWLRWLFAGEVTLAALFVGGPLLWLAVAAPPWKWAWAATLWSYTAVALGYAIWNRRGVWTATGDSLAAQLELEARRCRRARRTLLFVPLLMVAEAAAIVALFEAYFPGGVARAWQLLAACGAGVAVWAVLFELQIRRRLARLAAFERELAGD